MSLSHDQGKNSLVEAEVEVGWGLWGRGGWENLGEELVFPEGSSVLLSHPLYFL